MRQVSPEQHWLAAVQAAHIASQVGAVWQVPLWHVSPLQQLESCAQVAAEPPHGGT